MTAPDDADPPRQDVTAERDAYTAGRDQHVTVHNTAYYGEPRARKKPLRVLVSWTSDDLRDHREQVRRALRRVGVEEVESDAAARPLADHLAEVRGCDLFICVLAWRYGPVPEGREHSLPELELRAAREAGVESLVFLLSDREPWPPGAMDRGEAAGRVDALRAELASGQGCEEFTTAVDLGARVEELVTPRGLGEEPASRADAATAAHWRAYRRRLIEEYGRLDLEALTPPEREEYLQLWLRDVFVEPDVRQDAPPVELPKELWRKLQDAKELSPSDVPRGLGLNRDDLEKVRQVYRTRPTRALFDVAARPAERLCVLLGDPGAGKSTVARYLALALAQDRLPPRLADLDGHEPVLIELRDYAAERARNRCAGFGEYLAHRARTDGLGVPAEALEARLSGGGPALVIFDGLDELFDPREREAVAREIAWFASSHPTARVLVTSRIVGYRRRILEEAGFTHYTVQDLGGDQIEEFLTSWYGLALHDRPALAEQRRLRLTGAIDDSPPIRELAGNPLLLTILAIIGKHRELPRERWKVYDHAAGVLVEHWDVNKHLSDARVDADVIREDDKKDLLRRLAYRMQLGTEGLAGNHIWKDDLVEEIVGYLQGRFQYDLARATAIANAIVEQFHERNFVLARYGPRIYGFVHRALLEFFCASEIVARFEKTRALTEEQLREEVFEVHWEDPAWTEVLRLVAGMVDATVTGRLLEHLLHRVEPVRTTVLDKPPLGAVTLAVQCLAEVRSLGSAERSARALLDAIIELLRAPDRSFADDRQERLETAALPAIAAIGPAWPGRDHFLHWFRRHASAFVSWRACRLAPRILAALYSDTPSVRAMLADMARHDGVAGQRRTCLLAVVERWPDQPGTRELVADLLRDHADALRQTAVEQLAAHWPDDPGTRAAVHDALYDAAADVRRAAVEQVAARWPREPATLAAVQGRLDDPDSDVREAALEQLTANWATRHGTLDAVHRAARDPHWSVRRAAVRALDSSWARVTETLAVLRHAAADVDEDVRQAAIRALADRFAADPGTYPAVLDAVTDPDPQVGAVAVEQLASRWPDRPETLDALRRACRSPHGEVQCAAAVAVARRADGDADPAAALLERLGDPRNDDVRQAALELVGEHRAGRPEVLRAVLRATADPMAANRVAAMRVLSRYWPAHPKLRDACLSSVCEFEADVRKTGMETLAAHWGGDPALLPVFLAGARDAAWMVRKVALETLAARWGDDPAAVEAIERLTRDPAGLIRDAALEALVALGADQRRAADALDDPHRGARRSARRLLAGRWQAGWTRRTHVTAALASPLGAVRRTALASLVERFGADPETWAAVERALADNDPDVRLLALGALLAADRDEDRVRAAVLAATRDPEGEVRGLALRALLVRWRLDPATRATVRRMTDDLSGDVRRTALEALVLAEPDAPETFDRLTMGCQDDDAEARKRAVEALAAHRPGFPEAASVVLAASDDTSAEVRRTCVRALSLRWRDADGVFARVARAVCDPSDDVRLAALGALTTRWSTHPETPALVGRLLWDETTRLRGTAYVCLAFLGAAEARSLPLDRPAAAAAVAHPDSRVRATGLSRLLLAWPDAPETRRAVRIAFQDEEWPVRGLAFADLVRRMPDPDAAAVLDAGLRSPSEAVRELALWGLATALPGDPRCRGWIERALDDPAPNVRDTAIDLVARLYTGHDEWLRRKTADPSARVRVRALSWLAALRPSAPETVRVLARRAGDPDDDVRAAALEALLVQWPDAPETVDALRLLSRSPGQDDRDMAGETLDRRDRRGPRDLAETVRAAGRGHPAGRADAVHELVLRWPDEPATLRAVCDAAAAESAVVRHSALREIGSLWLRDPGCLAAVERAVADEDDGVRYKAHAVLSDGYHPDGRHALVPAARTDPYWALRALAMRHLVIRRPFDPETVETLREMTADRDWYIRRVAFGLLHQTARTRAEDPWPGACDPNAATEGARRHVLGAGDRPLPLTPPGLLPLWDGDPRRAALITAHLRGDDPDLRPELVPAALGDDHAAHGPALAALATWWPDDPETRETLLAATRHDCPRLRGAALAALYTRPDETVRALAREALADPVAPIRYTALNFLDVTGPLDTATLLRLAADPDEDVAMRAMESVGVREPDDPGVLAELQNAAAAFHVPGPARWVAWRRETAR
ncbi:HEAT repeat domain-containing protein [Actinomadura chibensis]|uniref:DUF4062 domain-containing protein n=1 Tax=Actinomadura chibensis TaxID=392828 RepID=A0A5D0NY74_9ACTN|nr:HEAT repeat domain-containing protein [Actinomadura chibensis]TYB49540.1 DUF4062 domain-containing protein [Actinomadura chibensis]